jgi:carboxymethylenebutenolidase
VLLWHEAGLGAAAVADARARLERAGLVTTAHELSSAAAASDRRALVELDGVLDRLRARPDLDPERLGVLGFGRGGTLAFLLGCTRRLAALVDVAGPVLHQSLSPERPTQPLELALNLEGAFLGVFAERGAVGAEERALLRERLTSAARPFEIVIVPDARDGFFDPRASGYDASRAAQLWRGVLSFLDAHLAAGSDPAPAPES